MQQLVAVINNKNSNHQQVPWPGCATCICSHMHMHMRHISHMQKMFCRRSLFAPPLFCNTQAQATLDQPCTGEAARRIHDAR